MRYKKAIYPEPKSSEITSEASYMNRRELLVAAGITGAGLSLPAVSKEERRLRDLTYSKVDPNGPNGFHTSEALTPYEDVTRYNNFYEFGTGKGDPQRLSGDFNPRPWTIRIEGEVANPGVYQLEDFIKPFSQQERVYRMRCVEAWSMVIPWVGIELRDILNAAQPTGNANYVAFETLVDKKMFPGQRSFSGSIRWPYREGLRLDEAMHPLTLMATGLYGKELPAQNGAPMRLVVPWKYGFKSIKSIVSIKVTKRQPSTSWNQIAAREYGFYANVKSAG